MPKKPPTTAARLDELGVLHVDDVIPRVDAVHRLTPAEGDRWVRSRSYG